MDSPSNGSQGDSSASSPCSCLSLISVVRNTDHSSQFLLSRDDTHTHHGDLPLTVYPTPDSSILVDLEASACKRLISHTFSPHEVVTVIEEIFTSQEEVRIVGTLRRDGAQAFIDVIHEVSFHVPSFPSRGLISHPLRRLPLIRLWIFLIFHHGSGGSV